MVDREQKMNAIIDAVRDAVDVFDEYDGAACTYQALKDSVLHVRMLLKRAGYDMRPRRDNLAFRGAILDELWAAGFFKGTDNLFHLDPQKRKCGDAEGLTLAEVAQIIRDGWSPPK